MGLAFLGGGWGVGGRKPPVSDHVAVVRWSWVELVTTNHEGVLSGGGLLGAEGLLVVLYSMAQS